MDQEEKQRSYDIAEVLLSEQDFAAAIYGIVVARWNFSYGFAAIGIGIAVGLPMQYLGRGIEMKFALAASVYTIAGCVLGNVFRVVSPLDVFRSNDFLQIAGRWVSYVSLVDLVFWFVAVWCSVFLVKRPLSRSERLAIGMYELKD